MTLRLAAVGMWLTLAGAALAPVSANARSAAPSAEQFPLSRMAVFPDSQVSLHWNTGAYQFFVFTAVAGHALPNFGSPAAVTWAPPGGHWNGRHRYWRSAATAVTVAIPADASPGTVYVLRLYTCNASTRLCSNTRKRSPYSQVALVVAGSNWSSIPYTTDFSDTTIAVRTDGNGLPIDAAVTADGTIWVESEFGNALGELAAGGSALNDYVDPTDVEMTPFAYCFSTCAASAGSELGERIVAADGRIWFTEGGWEFYDCTGETCPANHSEIVSFDPATGHFCTYQPPGDDNEVFGIASTGSAPDNTIWFLETNLDHPYLDSFAPADVGDGCPGSADEFYSLDGYVRQIAWPTSAYVPAEIAVDPDSPVLWVSDFWGSAISKVDENSGQITEYPLVSHNSHSFFGPEPWQIYADSGYVYAIDFGDSNLIRLDKTTGHIDYVAIPLVSDNEVGYGLAVAGGRLYFSLTGTSQPLFGATSQIGYVDIAAWEAASARCSPGGDCAPAPPSGVVYTGLFEVADPSGVGSFSGIAAGPGGMLAITDYFSRQVLRLTP